MYLELECETEIEEGVFCDFVGEVEIDRSAGTVYATCPKCNYEHEWDDDLGTNPAEL